MIICVIIIIIIIIMISSSRSSSSSSSSMIVCLITINCDTSQLDNVPAFCLEGGFADLTAPSQTACYPASIPDGIGTPNPIPRNRVNWCV